MKVLIAGGAGYIGGAITDLLATQAEYEIRVYDSLLYEESYRKPVPFVCGDVRDREKLLSHLQWADAVIWLAAVVGDAACALDPQTTVEVNQDSVRWLSENFAGRIVFMSTCSVYGAADSELDEWSLANPLSVYATTKLAAESYLINANAIIFRLGTLYGLSDFFSRVRFDLVVNTLTLRAHTQGRISVFGGDQYRPLLHVRDAAAAVVSALDSSACGVYNLSRINMTISEVADVVSSLFPGLVVSRTATRFEDNRNYRVSSQRARENLGFNPGLAISKGIGEIRALLDEGRLVDLSNSRYWNDQHLSAAQKGGL